MAPMAAACRGSGGSGGLLWSTTYSVRTNQSQNTKVLLLLVLCRDNFSCAETIPGARKQFVPPKTHTLLHVKRFRGGLGFKAHRLLYKSTLGLIVTKKKSYTHHGGGLGGVGVLEFEVDHVVGVCVELLVVEDLDHLWTKCSVSGCL